MFEPEGKFMAGNTLGPKPNGLVVPWLRRGTPGYRLGGNKFDLNRSPINERVLHALQSLRCFMNTFQFVRMKPDKDFVGKGLSSPEFHRALSEPGKQYALYIHHSRPKVGGSYKVVPGTYREDIEVRLPAGRYRAEWVEPESGSVLSLLI